MMQQQQIGPPIAKARSPALRPAPVPPKPFPFLPFFPLNIFLKRDFDFFDFFFFFFSYLPWLSSETSPSKSALSHLLTDPISVRPASFSRNLWPLLTEKKSAATTSKRRYI